MGVKKTNSEFVKEVEALVGREYVFLEDYTVNKNPTLCLHTTCGNEWRVAPRDFLYGNRNRCPMCSRNRMTNKSFSERILSLVGEDYIFLEEYSSLNKKILCKHNIDSCGYEYYVYPNHFLSGTRCPSCLTKNKRKTNDEFTREIRQIVGNEYTFLDKHTVANKKIKVRHNSEKCNNHSYEVTPNKFLSGRRCPVCSAREQGDNKRKTQKQFEDEVLAISGDEYTFLEKYKSYSDNIKVVHNICKFTFKTTPSRFISSGNRCPACSSMSNGEDRVRLTLENFNINFTSQYRIPECRYKYPLPFDFAIFDNHGDLNLLVEYDGQQHFVEGKNSFNNTDDDFKDIVIRDEIKNRYCRTNGVKLLRIPYWEFDNVEAIIFDSLINVGLIVEEVE